MAAGVAHSSVLPCSLQIMPKGRNSRNLASCRISSLAIIKTASNHLALHSTTSEIFSVHWSHHPCLTGTSKQLGETVSCLLDVSSCTHMIITGYWVGPDVDDGWGYVEASVQWSAWFFMWWCSAKLVLIPYLAFERDRLYRKDHFIS